MARIHLLTEQEIEPEFHKLLGRPDEGFVRLFGYLPEHLRRFLNFHRLNLADGLLPVRLKELVRLKIAELNQCAL